MESPEDCRICVGTYSESIRPRVLLCGHSFCSRCLENLIRHFTLYCPLCKREHLGVSSSADFPINYDLEHFISDLKRLGGSSNPNRFLRNIRSKTTHTLVAEHVSNAKEILLSAEDMETQLEKYGKVLSNYLRHQEELHRKFCERMKWHDNTIQKIKEETEKIAKLQKDLKDYHKSLTEILPSITDESHGAMSNSAADAFAKAFVNMGDLGNLIEKSKLKCPNREIIASQKVAKLMEEMLDITEPCWDGDLLLNSFLLDDKLTILEKFTKCKEESSRVTAEEMKRNPDFWKKTIASGKVWAVRLDNGFRRCAKMTLEDGKIYLHHLQDREIPPSAYTIKHSEVLSVVDKNLTTAFLDLKWDVSFRGRVHISLSPDTPPAQQFRILCTGVKGHTYAQTNFFEVVKKGCTSESIIGGDYMCNNGSGNTVAIEGGRVSNEIRDWVASNYSEDEAGAVWTEGGTKSAQFHINTGQGRTIRRYGVFGKVKDGMNVLKSAVGRLESRNDVKVVRCGIIIPLLDSTEQ